MINVLYYPYYTVHTILLILYYQCCIYTLYSLFYLREAIGAEPTDAPHAIFLQDDVSLRVFVSTFPQLVSSV